MSPKLKLYQPKKRDGRWFLRADLDVWGERIELQANASERLEQRARAWFNRGAKKLASSLKLDKLPGVFADVPAVASTIGQSRVVPYDPDVAAAADLFTRAKSGDPAADAHLRMIIDAARHCPIARDALEHLRLIELALYDRDRVPMQKLFLDVADGSPHAAKTLAALHQTAPAQEPTRVEWWVDDYVYDPYRMTKDVLMATGDEIGARIVQPARSPRVRRVTPGNGQYMLHTFRELLRRYS